MTSSAIVVNLVLSIAVTALVAGIAFFVPFLLDRPARTAASTVTADRSAEYDVQLAA